MRDTLRPLTLFVLGIFFILPLYVQAVIISEIMYDPQGTNTGRIWVEIYNDTSNTIDLTKYKILDHGANVNGHPISSSTSSGQLAPSAYAVVASGDSTQFLTDFPGFSGILLKASLSFYADNPETVSLKDDSGNIVDTVSYTKDLGAHNDGNSLQKISGSFVPATPTPGTENVGQQTSQQNSPSSQNDAQSQNTIVSTHYVSNDISLTPTDNKEVTLTASAGRNRLVAAGSPIQFHATVGGNAPKTGAEYKWSLGDGFIAYGPAIDHIYTFPGDYVAVLTVTSGPNVAVHRINVKVIEPNLSAKHITGGIEIKNNGKDEVNLFKWLVSSGPQSYTIPADLIIMPGKSVTLNALVTKLPDYGDITITNAEGKVLVLNKKDETPKQKNVVSANTVSKEDVKPIVNLAATNAQDLLVIEHKGFFGRIGDFIKRLFSSP